MYYVSVETTWWKDRDTIEASSHVDAATMGLARAFPKHDIPVGCKVSTHEVMHSTYASWIYDGNKLVKQPTRSD